MLLTKHEVIGQLIEANEDLALTRERLGVMLNAGRTAQAVPLTLAYLMRLGETTLVLLQWVIQELIAHDQLLDRGAQDPPTLSASESGRRCHNCGKVLVLADGDPGEETPEDTYCAECSEPRKHGRDVCTQCGLRAIAAEYDSQSQQGSTMTHCRRHYEQAAKHLCMMVEPGVARRWEGLD